MASCRIRINNRTQFFGLILRSSALDNETSSTLLENGDCEPADRIRRLVDNLDDEATITTRYQLTER